MSGRKDNALGTFERKWGSPDATIRDFARHGGWGSSSRRVRQGWLCRGGPFRRRPLGLGVIRHPSRGRKPMGNCSPQDPDRHARFPRRSRRGTKYPANRSINAVSGSGSPGNCEEIPPVLERPWIMANSGRPGSGERTASHQASGWRPFEGVLNFV